MEILVLYKTKMKLKKRNFLYKLSCIRSFAFSFFEKELGKSGIRDLPPSFGDILLNISSLGECCVKDIVAHSYRDKSTVSNIVNRLEKTGYIRKRSDPDDGRKVRIRVSEKYMGQLEPMTEISERLKEKLFRGMSEEEIEILFILIDKIEKNIKK
jgi:DNA-binding MarR family transcriptional regulator